MSQNLDNLSVGTHLFSKRALLYGHIRINSCVLPMICCRLRTRVTRNCATVDIPTVNGRFPGPTIEVNEGDTLVIKVTNKQQYPVTLHWHGIKQFRTNYADGPAHITQCPIQPNKSYIYEFTVNDQRGTFFWHAHVNWMRATVHGALIIHPKKTAPYGEVEGEIPIIMGKFTISPPAVDFCVKNSVTCFWSDELRYLSSLNKNLRSRTTLPCIFLIADDLITLQENFLVYIQMS